ncbi:surfactin synthase thioesterase subunit [Branchiibius hedensis]|uniref:Surfactin synthase thioesterase subunit n=1 Tax=Branchiibius hedensis TaxID=672460 RepID=A0A2Y9C6X4_9MICO|nr:thioesterase domain-containing protein [Branchiibius hedensis]PWJ23316.1 surfactin synthase thioesterase subunit [Branchiibius hedensis]SSA59005.1 Surfactin synthase thioesterase subunit [Branchiibius hedensis]
MRDRAAPWLVDIDLGLGDDSEDVVYAFPQAGAGAAAVRPLCADLGWPAATAAVRLPGREARLDEAPLTDLAMLSDGACEAIVAHARGRRVTLLGHCSGAVIAFEVARRLDPSCLSRLVVSAHCSPSDIVRRGVWRWPTPKLVDLVSCEGRIPAEVMADDELLELVVPAIRADYQALETYQVDEGAAVDADVIAVVGYEDHLLSAEQLRGWSRHARGRFTVHVVPGPHDLLHTHHREVSTVVRRESGWW